MLLRNAARIVLEIDGIQHYAEDSGMASPSRYAEMVAEDRRIRNLGYEVYRFGASELQSDSASSQVRLLFQQLFEKHGIRV